MTLTYELQFFDYWHLSSGLSAGAKLDSTVVKDANNLPYAPGKTIKGLVKEMLELSYNSDFIHTVYFSNATLTKEIQEQIFTNSLQENLYDVIASTAIGKDGIAKDNSLREIEVVVPLSLHGEVRDVPSEYFEYLKKAFLLVKRAGLHRNRGLGRCKFIVGEKNA